MGTRLFHLILCLTYLFLCEFKAHANKNHIRLQKAENVNTRELIYRGSNASPREFEVRFPQLNQLKRQHHSEPPKTYIK